MNRDYRDYPASIWDAIGDVDQGICCAALGGVVWDFMSHLTPAQLLAAMDSATLETLRAIRDILEDDTPETLQRRVMEQCEWSILPRAVSLFCEGRLHVEGRHVKITEGAVCQ